MSAPLPLSDLLTRVWERLGRNTVLYPETEIIDSGLNPAQTLLVLLNHTVLTKRVTALLIAEEAFIDLRQVAPRLLHLNRVVLGNVVTDDPSRSLGRVSDLKATTREHLRWKSPAWWRTVGVPKQWYPHGRYWIAVYPRAVAALTLTLVYTALPTPFSITEPQAVSDLPVALHPVIADIAAALLLCKEGQIETQRAIQHLAGHLGQGALQPAQKALGRLQRRQMVIAGQGQQESA